MPVNSSKKMQRSAAITADIPPHNSVDHSGALDEGLKPCLLQRDN